MIRLISSVLMLRVVGIGFQLGWFMLLVRLLPMEQVGIYSAINAFWLLMRAVGPMGSDQALMRRLPSLLEAGDLPRAQANQRGALRYLLTWHSAALGVLLLVALGLRHFELLALSPAMLLLIAACALFYGINGQQVYVMLAAKRPILANGFETIWLPLALTFSVCGLQWCDALSLERLLLAQALIMLGFCLFGLWLVHYRLLAHRQPAVSLAPDDAKDFAQQSRDLFATSAVIHLNMRLPLVIAPFLIGAANTALLEAAMRFATLLGLVSFAAAQVELPSISAYAQQANREKLQQLLHQSSWLIFAPTLALYGALALLGEWLIGFVAGSQYVQAYAAMLLLGAAYVFAAAAGPMQHVFTMSGKAALVSLVSLLEGGVSLVLMLLLTSQAELGIAAAIAVGMMLRNGLFHWLLPARLQLAPGVLSPAGVRWLLRRLR